MFLRQPHSLAPLFAYHGCDRELAEAVIHDGVPLQASNNDYDWLGPGIYFWVDSPERALEWAKATHERNPQKIREPAVVGAYVVPRLCLNFTDYAVRAELKAAHGVLEAYARERQETLPQNLRLRDGKPLMRYLDCAVIRTLHKLRERAELPAYDTVYGVFEEGNLLYPEAGFREKTHVQIAIRNPDCLMGYFHPRTEQKVLL
jgi:hypothetical protein